MSKIHVFNAGPCLLPQVAIDNTIEALKDFKGTGVSLISISHRTPGWDEVMNECRALWKEILDIPDTHEVVFLGGGASLEFLYVAMNFLEKKAGYLDTGVWAKKAYKEAKGIGEAICVASSSDKNYSYIPKGYEIPSDLDYFHITTNNTIYGTEIKEDIDCPVPLIADMSSDILSRRVDVSKYALIYGGAQKNAGPAGVAFAIVRKDALGKVSRYIPTMLDYRVHIDKLSMFNTPPVFSIFVMNETLKWLKSIGGIDAIHAINVIPLPTNYAEFVAAIDAFEAVGIRGYAADFVYDYTCMELLQGWSLPELTSLEGQSWRLSYEDLQDEFMKFSKSHNIVGIKGHRSVGGFRASIYNACTQEDVDALIACMQEFETLHKK